MTELRIPKLNVCVIAGRLTRDVETCNTHTGKAVASSAIAVDRYLGRGEPKSEAMFFELVAWEKTAEMLAERFKKGDPLVVEGRLAQERWEDKQTGQRRSRVVVVVNRVQALSWPSKDAQKEQPTPEISDNGEDNDEDEIPF